MIIRLIILRHSGLLLFRLDLHYRARSIMMDSNAIIVRYVRARAWRNIFEVTPACVFNFYSYYFGRRIVELKAAIVIS